MENKDYNQVLDARIRIQLLEIAFKATGTLSREQISSLLKLANRAVLYQKFGDVLGTENPMAAFSNIVRSVNE